MGSFARCTTFAGIAARSSAARIAARHGGWFTHIISPHCLNSLGQDYPQFDGHYEVVHHTQYLGELVAAGKLKAAAVMNETVTYHDPCYLARVNGITEAPPLLPDSLREMPRHGCQTACCGAGGGRMWFDDPTEERIGTGRSPKPSTPAPRPSPSPACFV